MYFGTVDSVLTIRNGYVNTPTTTNLFYSKTTFMIGVVRQSGDWRETVRVLCRFLFLSLDLTSDSTEPLSRTLLDLLRLFLKR